MTYETTAKRLVACRILSFAGWIEASISIAARVTVVDHLNRPEQLYRLVNAQLPGQTVVLPFFSLTRASTVAVVPVDESEIPIAIADRTAHKTVWLLHDGIIIEGLLDLFQGVRVADHLAHRAGFVALHDCTVYMPNHTGPTTVFPRVPFLALQTDRAIGTSEIDGTDHGQ